MKRTITLAMAAAVLAAWGGASMLVAEPALDQKLVIDGKEMITQTKAVEGSPFDTVISGWHYRTPETRELEADAFQNPAMLWIEQGETIWNTVEGEAGKSCATCHGNAAETMKGVGAAMPKWNESVKKPVNLEAQIDLCRTEQMKAEAYKFDDEKQKSIAAYVRYQSQGLPVGLDLAAGDMKSWWDRGKELYYTRMGQLDLSCASCHELNNGNYIRADHLSQGNINGFPTYRLKQGSLISVHNRFKGCIRDVRAEPFKEMSDEFMALEVYVAWRGTGLSVETPAVRQ